jgi:hypothetical protein
MGLLSCVELWPGIEHFFYLKNSVPSMHPIRKPCKKTPQTKGRYVHEKE